MSKYPHLPLFTDAFIADTGHLSAQETGAYLMLLMMAWRLPDCRLPDDDDKLSRWARVDRRTWQRIKPKIMGFWSLVDGVWAQARLSKEREIVSKRAEVARDNGKHGGRPKSLENNDQQNPTGSSWVTHEKAPIPIPIPTEKKEPKGSTKKRGCRLPEDWQPDEVFAAREGLTAWEITKEADKFRDYWRDQPGQRGVKVDWAGTWRNWVRKAVGNRKPAKQLSEGAEALRRGFMRW